MIADDLASFEPKLARHRIPLGDCDEKRPATLGAYGETVLLTGVPEAGKAVATTTLLEALGDRKYQFCVIDPKGDYAELEDLEHTVTVGDTDRTPSYDEMIRLLEKPDRHAVIALSAVAPAERPAFFLTLMTRLWDLRKRYGRPHWIVVNDAQLLMPAPASADLPRLRGSVMVTSDLRQLAPAAMEGVSTLVAAGPSAPDAVRAFCVARGVPAPALPLTEGHADADADTLDRDHAILWRPDSAEPPRIFRVGRCRESRR
jgi:hypothetical protein